MTTGVLFIGLKKNIQAVMPFLFVYFGFVFVFNGDRDRC